ncbi:hypothetical protein [Rhodococcus sp. NPDC058521]|uniref:hypothetical protein n=1 Tax=Rhodococcus sp. NPDC058521 TaxID=3346536 RepID=UPI003654C284
MRKHRSGTIVQMSSQGGRIAFPGIGAYSSASSLSSAGRRHWPVRWRPSVSGC